MRVTTLRVSGYVIGAPLVDERFFLLLHGLKGTLDKVPASTGDYLVEHRGGPVTAPPWDGGDSTEEHLKRRGYLTELSEQEERALLVDVATRLHQAELAASPPDFVFVPAYTCNLRCPYCFQSHEMHAGKGAYATVMSRERVEDAFRIIDRFNKPGAVGRHLDVCQPAAETPPELATSPGARLGLFGGEPLAEPTREIVGYIVEQTRSRHWSLWAITNGVQLELFADLLGPDAIAEVQITLDGMPELHDRRRVGPRFRKTFHQIADNIDLALDKAVEVHVRINVDDSNADHVAKLNDFFFERGWSSHPAFWANAAVVTGESKHQTLISHADLAELTSSLRREGAGCVSSYERYASDVLVRVFAGGYPFQRVAYCSAQTGLLMFDPRGDLYGCWDEIGLADRRIGRYHDGALDLDEEVARGWLARFPGAIEQCSRCPYALIHHSGCASQARNDTGSIFAAACEAFQTYFPQTLAESYGEIEQRLLGERRPARKGVRNLPIVEVTNGMTSPTMREASR